MDSTQTKDLITRAQSLYHERFQTALESAHLHSFVAIEPESGEYFLGSTLSEAAAACRAVHPDRRSYVLRVGHRAAVHLGEMR